jgi:GNAT superfamily N-acetyltransferase
MLVYAQGDEQPIGLYALSMKSIKQRLLAQSHRDAFFSKYSDQFPSLSLDWVAVRSDLQDKGVGKFIMGIVIDEFYQCIENYGLQAMTLEAIDQKTEDFYHRLGFRRYGPPVLRRQMIIGARPVLQIRRNLDGHGSEA